ncbi:MAG: hypothetical protein K5Q68_00815 [Roseococcus sp.]|nr:hypothetical protein [Roseococcus sp.]
MRDIAANPQSSNIFYLAADQAMLGQLRHKEGNTYRTPTASFRYMVGTILLETALRSPGNAHAATHARLLAMTLSEFNRLSELEQLAYLNDLWDTCYRSEIPSTDAQAMMDGLQVTTGEGSLPSSLRPKPGNGFATGLDPGPVPDAWTRWQTGFRVEGGKSRDGTRDDLDRVRDAGIQPVQKNPDLAVRVARKYYHKHKGSISPDLYIGYQNRDLYNESGTCVSRSLIGGTAFPYRDTFNNRAGLDPSLNGHLSYQYLFALDCAGLKGVDTESKQIQEGNDSLWRPGEKAFPGIPKGRVLGYARVIRRGKPPLPNGIGISGWAFQLLDTSWTWLREPQGPRRIFLDAELAAWQAHRTYVIEGKFDFQGA